MRRSERIVADRYVDVEYHQFTQGPAMRFVARVAGILSWILILPLALVSRLSDFIFRTSSEFLAVVPFIFGVVMRYEFYRFALKRCGKNVNVGFGTVFIYRDVEIGDHASIGNFVTIHHCDIGNYALIADGCRFYSGSKYHHYTRGDVPMALQGGQLKRIKIGDDTWIGANSVIMSDVGKGSIVGAGSVVASPVSAYTVVTGNPARKDPMLTSLRRSGRREDG